MRGSFLALLVLVLCSWAVTAQAASLSVSGVQVDYAPGISVDVIADDDGKYACPSSFSTPCGSFTPPPCGPDVRCIYKCSVDNGNGNKEYRFCKCTITGRDPNGGYTYGYECIVTNTGDNAVQALDGLLGTLR